MSTSIERAPLEMRRDATTHTVLSAVGPVFSLLLIGFGLGIWRSAHGKRSLRIAGALVVAHGATSFLWLLGPNGGTP